MEYKTKLAKDLKVGDKCYAVDIDGEISVEFVKNLKFTDDKVHIVFETSVTGYCRKNDNNSSYGLYSSKVFFDKENATKCLIGKIDEIQKNIDKLLNL